MNNNTFNKIELLVKVALKTNDERWENLEKVSKLEEAIISDNFKIELTNYVHFISTNEIRHTFKRHGEASNDRNPVTAADFLLIPVIHSTFDRIVLGGITKKTKNQCVIYEKRIGDIYYCVEEIRTGRKKLAFSTLYKRKSRL